MLSVKISSITYVKNGAEYIEKCINSIIKQTLYEIQIIVVDGGSTDGTKEIIENIAKNDNRVLLLEHSGSVGGQFNVALNASVGEYIAICEADDYILPNKFEQQYKIAYEENLDVIYGCFYNFFQSNRREYRYRVDTGIIGIEKDKTYNSSNYSKILSPVNGFWSGLYKRDFLINNRILMNETPGAAYQDITFSFLTQVYAKLVYFGDEEYHCYRIDNPLASVNSPKCIEMLKNEYDLLRRNLLNRKIWERYKYDFLIWEVCSYKHFLEFIDSENKEIIAENIYEILIEQRIEKDDYKHNIPDRFKKTLKGLNFGKDIFVAALLEHEENKIRLLSYFENRGFNEEGFILFGIGNIGQKIFDFFTAANKKVLIVDNSMEMQSKGYCGNKVFSPEEVVNNWLYPIIVANANHSKDIYNQLIKLGVSGNRIYICDDEELFLRKIFVGMGELYGIK